MLARSPAPRPASSAFQPAPQAARTAAVRWLLPTAPLLLASLGAAELAETARELRLAAGLHLAALALTLAALACCKWGLWRLARRRARQPGGLAHGWLLKVLLVVGLMALAGVLAQQQRAAQVLEMGRIALGEDPVPPVSTQITDEGEGLLLRGPLGGGSAARVRTALATNPGLRWVRLDSPGGRLLEAQTIATLLQGRGLATHVEGQCASACTVVLLAGRQRSAAPAAQVGFHRPQFAGVDAGDLGDTPALLAAYRRAGLGEDFIDRVRRTPSSTLWVPTRGELRRHGVLNAPR
jgi:hypothetical protein